jgi:hypothetical protein
MADEIEADITRLNASREKAAPKVQSDLLRPIADNSFRLGQGKSYGSEPVGSSS